MVSFTVRMRFEGKDQQKVGDLLRQLTAASRQEPGCVTYNAHFVADEPATVVIYEQYRDESALEHHRSSPHFKQFASGGLYQIMVDRKLETLKAIA